MIGEIQQKKQSMFMKKSQNKKILIYLFLLIIFGSINNKSFNNLNFFEIKNLRLIGLNSEEKESLLSKIISSLLIIISNFRENDE